MPLAQSPKLLIEHVALGAIRIDPSFAAGLPRPDNLDGIREDIRERGVLVPLLVTQDGLLLDGHTRLEIATELGHQSVPVIRVEVDAAETWPRTVALALNLHRRHLNVAQRVALGTSLEKIERALARKRQVEGARAGARIRHEMPLALGEPEAEAQSSRRPDRATARVAAQIGVSRNTYEKTRAILERGAQDVRNRLLTGDLSVGAAYTKLRRAEVKARAESESKGLEPGLYAEFTKVPVGRYRCLLADPPWDYQDKGCNGAATAHYPTLSADDLAHLDLARLAHPEGCHLWLWTTWPMLRDGTTQHVLDAWGFRWVSEFVWVKDRPGTGRWLRSITEVCILALRGELPLLVDDVAGIVHAARAQHSQKPSAARSLVERCSPGPRLELFARNVPSEWDAWGNECERQRTS